MYLLFNYKRKVKGKYQKQRLCRITFISDTASCKAGTLSMLIYLNRYCDDML